MILVNRLIGVKEAGRRRAAPHIKTYVRFTDSSLESIDWALVTSANLSNQAWGGASRSTRDVYIQSYEIGVLVWPELFGSNAKMVPTFKTDNPKAEENKVHTTLSLRHLQFLVANFRLDNCWLQNALRCATSTLWQN